MKRRSLHTITGSAAGVAIALAFGGTVSAQSAAQVYQANLSQINNSNTSGTTSITLNGNQATVTMNVTGASPNLAHATHLRVGGTASCPGNISTNTRDAQKSFGEVKVALTTSGDVSANSALAVDRMPKADAQGRISYNRTFTLPSGVTANDMRNATITQHGVASLGGDRNKYDGNAKSELNNALPAEATAPSACGKLTAAPSGGVATGGGSTAGIEHPELFAIGAASLITAGSLTLLHVRKVALSAHN